MRLPGAPVILPGASVILAGAPRRNLEVAAVVYAVDQVSETVLIKWIKGESQLKFTDQRIPTVSHYGYIRRHTQ